MIPHLQRAKYPQREGHQVQFLLDGVAFYTRLLEAIRSAKQHILGTISFLQPSFCFLGGEAFWNVMQAASSSGISVKLLAWRNPHFFMAKHVFQGTEEDRSLLSLQAPDVSVRWDESLEAAHCHHQKMWLIDDVAFIGGMVLSSSTLDDQSHTKHPQGKHDTFVELRGPSVADVYHNFAQRWNASTKIVSHPKATNNLAPQMQPPPPQGDIVAQVSRTIKPGLYQALGESDIWEQYKLAFRHAKKTIYIENQHPGEEQLLLLLAEALRRGVRVVYIVPGEPMQAIYKARSEAQDYWNQQGKTAPRYASTFAALKELSHYNNFIFAALAHQEMNEPAREIYTHSKLCVVDAEWVCIGSANLVDLSLLQDHTELNVALWSSQAALQLLRQLFEEHTQRPAFGLDDVALLEQMQSCALENTERRQGGEFMRGHIYALDVLTYGVAP
jgi:cardiolipin synthase